MQFTKYKNHNQIPYTQIGLLILNREKRKLTAHQIAEIAIKESMINNFTNKPFNQIRQSFRVRLNAYIRHYKENCLIQAIAPATYQLNLQKPIVKLSKNELLVDYVLKLTPLWLYSFINQYFSQFNYDTRSQQLDIIFNYLKKIDNKFINTLWQNSIKIIDNSINMNDLAVICRYYSINNNGILRLVIEKLMENIDFIKFIENYKDK